ncbi:ABC-type antimicrobial peptide transport system permease subunit [Dysgonomonas hofstadii]|uniref:ABC-type antimicrobial peptide transport system permease subunit n=1 Tax=Dysgonomonas hofstadii TaxID=637886 RepID=A0A840CNH2_9BACT|nr:hypothetical protein [Dysgonomonas hofstadii]MBB4035618.1 ABC-type antimicrobial peptide transport system permease subunit [Dysgonomonas hofstadii]
MNLINFKIIFRSLLKNRFYSLLSIFSTALTILIGCFIAVNLYRTVFPEIDILLFLIAVLATIILMLLFALVSVWYPAHLASKTQPAIALKLEE